MKTITFERNYCKNTVYGWALTLTSALLVECLCLQPSICQPLYEVFVAHLPQASYSMLGKEVPS